MRGFIVVDTYKINEATKEIISRASQLANLVEEFTNKADQFANWESNTYIKHA